LPADVEEPLDDIDDHDAIIESSRIPGFSAGMTAHAPAAKKRSS
jgi:hypothetical protein